MNTALRCTTSAAAGSGLETMTKYLQSTASARGERPGETIKYLRCTTSGAAGNGRAQRSSTCDAQRAERRRGQRPGHHDQVPTRRRRHRFWHHDQVPSTLNERRRGQRPRIQLKPPCSAAAFVVNSKPHTGARSSVCLRGGSKHARCVHKSISHFNF